MKQIIFNILVLTENIIFTTLRFLVYDVIQYFMIEIKFKSLNLYRSWHDLLHRSSLLNNSSVLLCDI